MLILIMNLFTKDIFDFSGKKKEETEIARREKEVAELDAKITEMKKRKMSMRRST